MHLPLIFLALIPLVLLTGCAGDGGGDQPATATATAVATPTTVPTDTATVAPTHTSPPTPTPTSPPTRTHTTAPTQTQSATPTITPTVTPPATPTATFTPTVATVSHVGRWLTDGAGRVLLLHGVNFVSKQAASPAERGFGADDAAWLAANGFDVVRLGFSPDALMPTPGMLNAAYVDSFVETVDILRAHGLRVLVDLHQDGWGPGTSGNGFPAWMTLTHGAIDTMTPFPLYYITNPAIQAAFDSFWANELGPEDVPLQERAAAIFSAFASRLAASPNVLGYDLINEPWPGTDWVPCLFDPAGCPAQDAGELDPYYQRMAAAIREHDTDHLLFGEPFVLFNFGQVPTSIRLPGDDPASGLSFHVYTTDPSGEPYVVAAALQWSEATGGALLCSEFGASNDTAALDRQVGLLDRSLIPWIQWSYDEHVMIDLSQPASDANARPSTVAALVRPHPLAVAGTPISHDYDLATRVLRFSFSTTGPEGRIYPPGTESTFQVASRTYPQGYAVEVVGGAVTSPANAAQLNVIADGESATITVTVSPADSPAPATQRRTRQLEPAQRSGRASAALSPQSSARVQLQNRSHGPGAGRLQLRPLRMTKPGRTTTDTGPRSSDR